MPTITNVNNGAFPDTSRRSYISAAAFNTAIFTYTPEVQDGTGNVTPGSLAALSGGNSGNCPARRVLRETGKKLYPGVHSGVFTYMVSVYDNNNMWHGYIDPNSALFAVYNSDKPNFLLNGVDAATGAPADAGAPVITNGLVSAGTTITAGTSVTAPHLIVSPAATVAAAAGAYAGYVALSGGAATVTGVTLDANSLIFVTSVGAGTVRVVSFATGVGTGSFILAGTGTDQVNWMIVN
jgi:hypothetical protein